MKLNLGSLGKKIAITLSLGVMLVSSNASAECRDLYRLAMHVVPGIATGLSYAWVLVQQDNKNATCRSYPRAADASTFCAGFNRQLPTDRSYCEHRFYPEYDGLSVYSFTSGEVGVNPDKPHLSTDIHDFQ